MSVASFKVSGLILITPVIVRDMFQSLLLKHSYKGIIDCFSMLLIILALNKSLALKNKTKQNLPLLCGLW